MRHNKRGGYTFDDNVDMDAFLDFIRGREGFSVVKDRDRYRDVYVIKNETRSTVCRGLVFTDCLHLRYGGLDRDIEEYVASRAPAVDSSTSEQSE